MKPLRGKLRDENFLARIECGRKDFHPPTPTDFSSADAFCAATNGQIDPTPLARISGHLPRGNLPTPSQPQ